MQGGSDWIAGFTPKAVKRKIVKKCPCWPGRAVPKQGEGIPSSPKKKLQSS
jgi:hypothetical protein